MTSHKSFFFAIAIVGLLGLAALYGLETGGVRHITLPERTDDLPYSNAVLAGKTLFLAGALGLDPETGVPPQEVEQEIRIIMDGMKRRLEMVGMGMDNLVSVQVYCTDLALYDQFNAIYRSYFTKNFPARTFVGAGSLLRGGRFEVSGIAVAP